MMDIDLIGNNEYKGSLSLEEIVLSNDPDYKTARCTICHCLIHKDMSGYICANINSCPNNRQHVADLSRIAYVHSPVEP